MKADDNKRKLVTALRDSLQSVAFLKMVDVDEVSWENDQPGLVKRIVTPDGQWTLVVEFKSSGQPRFFKEGVNQLLLYLQRINKGYGILVAPFVSPESAQICKQAGIGYIDLAGNCFLNFDKIFVSVEGKKNPFPQNRDLRTIFSAKASRILRVLIMKPSRRWKTEALKRQADVSLGLVANVKKILLDREWAMEEKTGFFMSQPEKVLREWTTHYRYEQNDVYDFYSLKELPKLEEELRNYCQTKNVRWGLTLFSGANRIAPFTRTERLFAYVENQIEEIQDVLRLKSVDSGPNVTLMVPFDEGLFYNTENYKQMPVVSPVQLYLDLKNYKGRGEEAAEFLLERVIQPLWSPEKVMENER
jgi:hypothetical protein